MLVAESGSGDDVFIMQLRDLWHEQWNVDIHNEIVIGSLYGQLEQLEHAKQSQQSPTQVVLRSLVMLSALSCVENNSKLNCVLIPEAAQTCTMSSVLALKMFS